MIAALLALLLGFSVTDAPTSLVTKTGEVRIRFYDTSKIRGPFKVYEAANQYPAVSPACGDCPPGLTSAEHIVQPDQVFQTWPQGGKLCEIRFPLRLVSSKPPFRFTAVTLTPSHGTPYPWDEFY